MYKYIQSFFTSTYYSTKYILVYKTSQSSTKKKKIGLVNEIYKHK